MVGGWRVMVVDDEWLVVGAHETVCSLITREPTPHHTATTTTTTTTTTTATTTTTTTTTTATVTQVAAKEGELTSAVSLEKKTRVALEARVLEMEAALKEVEGQKVSLQVGNRSLFN